MRGPVTFHNNRATTDPILVAIQDLREQVDHLIAEQKAVLGGILGGLEEEAAVERPSPPAVEPAGAVPGHAAVEPPPKVRRPSAPVVFERMDEPSPTPPRPVTTAPVEPPPPSRSDDPRERLDALAKHLDRKLRQTGAPNGESPPRPSE